MSIYDELVKVYVAAAQQTQPEQVNLVSSGADPILFYEEVPHGKSETDFLSVTIIYKFMAYIECDSAWCFDAFKDGQYLGHQNRTIPTLYHKDDAGKWVPNDNAGANETRCMYNIFADRYGSATIHTGVTVSKSDDGCVVTSTDDSIAPLVVRPGAALNLREHFDAVARALKEAFYGAGLSMVDIKRSSPRAVN